MSIKNSNQHCDLYEYNCFTFALNIPDGEWQDPYEQKSYEFVSNALGDGMPIDVIQEAMIEKAKANFERKYDIRWLDAESIQTVNPKKEEIVQFRIGIHVNDDFYYDYMDGEEEDGDGDEPNHFFDFHFKVFRNGRWQEKNGAGPIHDCRPWPDSCGTWADEHGPVEPDEKYTSRTLTFAHRVAKRSFLESVVHFVHKALNVVKRARK